ncbi:MAG: DUF2007 domain-containing protein [Ignavibacteriae bacterium]|nr:DUF2007 domain-containing protein [Ignavibacteriota bacterium]
MSYCPQCFTEYVEGVAECSDCHVPLEDGPLVHCKKCEEPVPATDTFCDHCGVLLLDAETDETPECAEHPDSPAMAGCIMCGKPVCSECANEIEGKYFCNNDTHYTLHQDYAVVYRSSAEYEAEMIRANLESAGIDTQLFDQHGHVYFVDIGEMALVSVYVRKDEIERAGEIVQAILNSPPLEDDVDPTGAPA